MSADCCRPLVFQRVREARLGHAPRCQQSPLQCDNGNGLSDQETAGAWSRFLEPPGTSKSRGSKSGQCRRFVLEQLKNCIEVSPPQDFGHALGSGEELALAPGGLDRGYGSKEVTYAGAVQVRNSRQVDREIPAPAGQLLLNVMAKSLHRLPSSKRAYHIKHGNVARLANVDGQGPSAVIRAPGGSSPPESYHESDFSFVVDSSRRNEAGILSLRNRHCPESDGNVRNLLCGLSGEG